MKTRSIAALAALGSLTLGGCGFGLRTPELQEAMSKPEDGDLMVREIAKTVYLSVEKAVACVVEEDKHSSKPGLGVFESKWGVQMTLTLTIQESTSLNPGLSLNTPMHPAVTNFAGEFLAASTSPFATATYGVATTPQSYSLGLGGKASSQAQRIETAGAFYTVDTLLKNAKKTGRYAEEVQDCAKNDFDEAARDRLYTDPDQRKPSKLTQFLSLITNNDLKIHEWLSSSLHIEKVVAEMGGSTVTTGADKNKGLGQNAITHEVSFQVITDGNVTPTWRLVRVSANTSSPFFDAQRQRTHDLIVTFGPKDPKGDQLAPAAKSSHDASLFGQRNSSAFLGAITQ